MFLAFKSGGLEKSMEEAAKIFGQRIKAIRESKGLSQRQFADQIGSSYRAIQNYEMGISTPSAKVLEGIVGLGFNANWLLTGMGAMRIEETTKEFHFKQDMDLLISIIKEVDLFFSKRNLSPPMNVFKEIVLKAYDEIQKTNCETNEEMIELHFSKILSQI